MKYFVIGYSDPDDGGIGILAGISRPTRAEALQAIGSRDLNDGVAEAITPPTNARVSKAVRDACADTKKEGYSVLLVEVEAVA